jgi:hypothetical protein
MKKHLIMLTVLVAIKLSAISQTSDSVTCLPNSQLKKAINLIEQGKVVKEELEVSKKKIITLEEFLNHKDKIINEFQKKDSLSKNVIMSYEQAVINFQAQIKNAETISKLQKKTINRLKFRKFIALGLGFGAGFLIFH